MISLIKFVLVSGFFASVCLAAKRDNPHVCNVNRSEDKVGDFRAIMEQTPELLPPVLVSDNGWSRDLAIAFSLGLALGMQHNQSMLMNSSTSAAFEMVDWKYVETGPDEGKRVTVLVKNLGKAVLANSEWKDGNQAYNPFSELFNNGDIQNAGNDCQSIELVRPLFAQCAKKEEAMVAIDVANLGWMVHAIKKNPLDCHLVEIEESLIMSLCALSMIPQVREYCMDDILVVLDEVQKYVDPKHASHEVMERYSPSLFTLFKMLDYGPIQRKVEEIVKMMCPYSYLNAKMLLGKDYPEALSTEGYFFDEERTFTQPLLKRQAECHRKVYSVGTKCILGYEFSTKFIQICSSITLSAIVGQDNTLKWEGTMPTLGKEIYFSNSPSPHPKQNRLFIISQLSAPLPLQFWQDVTSCISILTFKKVLKKPAIRQTILTYGITILESSSTYEFKPADKKTSDDDS